ncbi:MAG TPA: CopG family transcriptional regulator [Planctomycetaceae bacterium]|nr:CopG family transcriptional regulator [Planctomycetaceae bacterium]
MIRTQISVDEELYRQAREIARRRGISLAELCRRSLAEAIAREPSDKPWMRFIGLLDGQPGDSTSVDSVVYGREAP